MVSLLVRRNLDLTIFEPNIREKHFLRSLMCWKPSPGFGKRPGLVDKLNRLGQTMAEVWEAIGCAAKLAVKKFKIRFFSTGPNFSQVLSC